MTLGKAIEILTDSHKRHTLPFGQDTSDALKLAIEAVKTIQEMRHYPFPDGVVQLPGETKED